LDIVDGPGAATDVFTPFFCGAQQRRYFSAAIFQSRTDEKSYVSGDFVSIWHQTSAGTGLVKVSQNQFVVKLLTSFDDLKAGSVYKVADLLNTGISVQPIGVRRATKSGEFGDRLVVTGLEGSTSVYTAGQYEILP
jgi:hypothetical protein